MPFPLGHSYGRVKDVAGRERIAAVLAERPHISARLAAIEAGVNVTLVRTYLAEQRAAKPADEIPVDEMPPEPPLDDILEEESQETAVIMEVAAKEDPILQPVPEERHPVVLPDIPALTVRQALVALSRAVRLAKEVGVTPEKVGMETYRARAAHAFLAEIFDFLDRYNLVLEQRIDQGAD